MPKYKVYVTRKIPGDSLHLLSSIANVEIYAGSGAPSLQTLLDRVQNCHGLLTMLSDHITSEIIDAAGPNLRIISNYAVGFNNVDVEYATSKSILVSHTPDVLTDSTADLTWALLLATARRVVESDQLIRTEQWLTWEPDFMLGSDVSHKTLGIIGLGRIGLAVAKRALGFQMRVLYYSRTRKKDLEQTFNLKYKSIETLLQESDFISLHVPLTSETKSLISTKEFSLMKPTAILINTARGGIVDENALVEALQKSSIKAAGLDVYQNEPTHNKALFHLSNVVLTPHIGSATTETRLKMAHLAVNNLLYGLTAKYEQITLVNPSVLRSLP
ncbi:MAG: D-glycerate dehydrogenase [Promethearchaeota archaeon]|nr:MAG: D-glycerate dehydrogenase [Candidatus Lokiarchaeota archaeon]